MCHTHTGKSHSPWLRYYQSPGYRALSRLSLIGLSQIVFARNFQQLSDLLVDASTEKVSRRLANPTNKQEINIIENELTRLLHNYLASAKTLIETVRVLVNEGYSGTKFKVEYQDEINKRFTNNPHSGFIEDLRNYALHYKLPIVDTEFWGKASTNGTIIEEPSFGIRFVLDTQQLAKWSGWKKGKQFLSNAGLSIDLVDLVRSYYTQVNDFHSWLDRRLKEMHLEDLAETAEIKRQIENQSASHLWKNP